MKRLLCAALLLGGFFMSGAEARTALVRSGLFDDFGIFTRPVEDGLRKQGYKVTRIPWWAKPNSGSNAPKSGRYDVAVGHSLGADRVLRDNARKIIAVDPTIANRGCVGHRDCTAYYGPANKLPLIICCGGYKARGAKNIAIAFGHISAPRIALPHILKQTRFK